MINYRNINTSPSVVIKSRRLELNLSIDELARRVNVRPAAIKSIESGTVELTLQRIVSLLNALQLEMKIVSLQDPDYVPALPCDIEAQLHTMDD